MDLVDVAHGLGQVEGAEEGIAVALVLGGGHIEDAVLQGGDGDAVIAGDVEGVKLLHGLVQLGMAGELSGPFDEDRVHLQRPGLQGVGLPLGQVQTVDLSLLTRTGVGRDDGVEAGLLGRLDAPLLHAGLVFQIAHCDSS